MNHPHASRQADADPSSAPSVDLVPSGATPDAEFVDAQAARLASRHLDEGMPSSPGFDDVAEPSIRKRFPALPGSVLSAARESSVSLPYEFVFRRLLDMPTSIVWDAVSDADMLSGWLAEASVEQREGGEFWFDWMTVPDRSLATAAGGVITRFVENRVIEYTFVDKGEISALFHLRLEDVPGGPRDRQTELVVTVSGVLPAGIANVLKASWGLHLDLLHDLLHGRPVDWETCEQEHGRTWRRYLAELESAES